MGKHASRYRSMTALIAAVSVLVWGCKAPDAFGPGGREGVTPLISGRVLDPLTGRGVADARVEISGVGVSATGTDGLYFFPATRLLQAQPITIVANVPGYHTSVAVVSLPADSVYIPTLHLQSVSRAYVDQWIPTAAISYMTTYTTSRDSTQSYMESEYIYSDFCGQAAGSPERIVNAAQQVNVPDFAQSIFTSGHLRTDINNIQSSSSGRVEVAEGEPYRIRVKDYIDFYGGYYLGQHFEVEDDEKTLRAEEEIRFSYIRRRTEAALEACHPQGSGG